MSSPPMAAIITISMKPARCFGIELRHQHDGAGGGASAAGAAAGDQRIAVTHKGESR